MQHQCIIERMSETRPPGTELGAASPRSYPDRMTASARDVAAELRARLPGLQTKKLQKLLYYCQGHHLAVFDRPLFGETISAWDRGPVVGVLWHGEKYQTEPPDDTRAVRMTEAELNTIGYVVSRYGSLTGRDLEHLSHSERPWQLANTGRRPGQTARIELDWIRDYFATVDAAADEEDDIALDSAAVTDWLAGAPLRREEPVSTDHIEDIEARLADRG